MIFSETDNENEVENIQDEQDFIDNPMAIIEMAFNPKASLKPNQSVVSVSGRPRKPHCTSLPRRVNSKS